MPHRGLSLLDTGGDAAGARDNADARRILATAAA